MPGFIQKVLWLLGFMAREMASPLPSWAAECARQTRAALGAFEGLNQIFSRIISSTSAPRPFKIARTEYIPNPMMGLASIMGG